MKKVFGLITIRHNCRRVEHHIHRKYYQDTELYQMQYFYMEYLLLGLFCIYRKTLFKEHVPVWAWSQLAVMGFTDWETSCPDAIWALCVKEGRR